MTRLEVDIEALQMLTGDDPVALGDCNWTCLWSTGGFCAITDGCWFTAIR
ncbi:hypothetical protein ACQUSR_28755 [Streptomyces sp. P1-3]